MFTNHLPKKYTPVILVALALLMLIVVSFIYGLDNEMDFLWGINSRTLTQNSQSNIDIPVEDNKYKGEIINEPDGWKTYINKGHGISFRFQDKGSQINFIEDKNSVIMAEGDSYLLYIHKYFQQYNLITDYLSQWYNWCTMQFCNKENTKLISIDKIINSNLQPYYKVTYEVRHASTPTPTPNTEMITSDFTDYYFDSSVNEVQKYYYEIYGGSADDTLRMQVVDSFEFID